MSFGGGASKPSTVLSDKQADVAEWLFEDFQTRYGPIIDEMTDITKGSQQQDIYDRSIKLASDATQVSNESFDRRLKGLGVNPSARQQTAIQRGQGLQRSLNVATAGNTARDFSDKRQISTMAELIDIGRGTLSEGTTSLNSASQMEAARNQINAQNEAARYSMNANMVGTLGTAAAMIAFGSSRDLKENIRSIGTTELLDMVNDIEVVEFNYIPGLDMEGNFIGMIAEDTDDKFTTADKKAVVPYNLIGALIGAVQELTAKVTELEARDGVV